MILANNDNDLRSDNEVWCRRGHFTLKLNRRNSWIIVDTVSASVYSSRLACLLCWKNVLIAQCCVVLKVFIWEHCWLFWSFFEGRIRLGPFPDAPYIKAFVGNWAKHTGVDAGEELFVGIIAQAIWGINVGACLFAPCCFNYSWGIKNGPKIVTATVVLLSSDFKFQ